MFSAIQNVYQELPAAERAVADFIVNNPTKALFMTVREISNIVSVSEGTVVRLAQRCGFRGFSEFKIQLAVDYENERSIYQTIDPDSLLQVAAHRVFDAHILALQNTLQSLNFQVLEDVVAAIHHSRKVEFYGVGSSGIVAKDAAHKLLRMDIAAWGVSDPHTQLAMASLLSSDCVAVGLSHSGMTRDTVDALRAAKQSGAVTVAVTSNLKSPICTVADYLLKTSVNEPSLRSGSVSSRMVQLAVIDTITMGLHLKRKEQTERLFEMTSSAVIDRKIGGDYDKLD